MKINKTKQNSLVLTESEVTSMALSGLAFINHGNFRLLLSSFSAK